MRQSNNASKQRVYEMCVTPCQKPVQKLSQYDIHRCGFVYAWKRYIDIRNNRYDQIYCCFCKILNYHSFQSGVKHFLFKYIWNKTKIKCTRFYIFQPFTFSLMSEVHWSVGWLIGFFMAQSPKKTKSARIRRFISTDL